LARRNRKEAYVSVYSDYQINHNIADTIFIDLDGDNGFEKLEKEVVKLGELPLKHRVYFTGGRGFHVFVDFSPTIITDLRGAADEIVDIVGSTTGADLDDYIDRHPLGDKSRMCRVPYTFHENTKKQMTLLWESGTQDIAAQLHKKFGKKRIPVSSKISVFDISLVKFPPCIEMCIELLRLTGELPHEARLFLATYLLKSGFTMDEVHQIFKLANDYDYRKTQYQLDYIVKRKMRCYSCIKLKRLNICPVKYAKCEFYPNVEWWF